MEKRSRRLHIEIKAYLSIALITILMLGPLAYLSAAREATAEQAHIRLTEAYANKGAQNNGIIHDWKRLVPGDTVFEGQPLQFREDFDQPEKILRVTCSIDNLYYFWAQCSKPFEGHTYSWILNAGIPTNYLTVGHHVFIVYIQTANGMTNTETFPFYLTKAVCFDSQVVNGHCV
jgi:hypothetical protein